MEVKNPGSDFRLVTTQTGLATNWTKLLIKFNRCFKEGIPIITLLFALLPLQVFANMGPPISVNAGSEVGSPFVNEHVDVLHEDLHIKVSEGFYSARFKAKYHIRVSKAGKQIPFLFYAADYQDSFSVTIDGKPVELKAIPPEYDIPEDTTLKDFSHFFGNLGQDV